jgi:hypothetical protein
VLENWLDERSIAEPRRMMDYVTPSFTIVHELYGVCQATGRGGNSGKIGCLGNEGMSPGGRV